MKKLLIAAAVAGLVGTANAQSAFEGFYGQITTGYESNSLTNLGFTGTEAGNPSINDSWTTGNKNANGMPLVIGAGYNFSVAPKWVVGLGLDYSLLSQKSSNINYSFEGIGLNGATVELSNRLNIYVTPGYEIDKDKLVYLKAGYSSISAKATGPNSITYNGASESFPSASQTKTLSGYVLGLGYKQIIKGGFYGMAEANYMSYSKTTFSSTADGLTSTSNPGLSSYQFLVGVGYKF